MKKRKPRGRTVTLLSCGCSEDGLPYPSCNLHKRFRIEMSADDFLEICRDASWDRPSAFYALAERCGIETPRELAMHGKYHRVYWKSRRDWLDERDYLRRVFAGRVPPILFTDEFDT